MSEAPKVLITLAHSLTASHTVRCWVRCRVRVGKSCAFEKLALSKGGENGWACEERLVCVCERDVVCMARYII